MDRGEGELALSQLEHVAVCADEEERQSAAFFQEVGSDAQCSKS